MIQIHADRVSRIERSREADQNLCEVGVDAPVVRVVGVGQCGTCHPAMKAHVIEFAAQRSQARFYIAKAIPVSELGKGHRQILIPTREASRPRISTVASDTTAKLAIRQKAQQLREDGSTLVHRPLWTVADSASRPVAVQIAASQNPAQPSERKALPEGEIFVSRTLVMSNIVRKALVLWACTARRRRCLHPDRRLRRGRCIAAGGAEFCAFLRCFSGKREKNQVSIGSGWCHWTRQASARIPSTERWIGPAKVTSHPSHASPTRTAFRSRVLRRRARRAEVPLCARGSATPRRSSHAVARRAR